HCTPPPYLFPYTTLFRSCRPEAEHKPPNYQRFTYYYSEMLEPEYYKVLLEIGVGRRFWQSNPSAENADAFYVRVVGPLRQLQRRDRKSTRLNSSHGSSSY